MHPEAQGEQHINVLRWLLLGGWLILLLMMVLPMGYVARPAICSDLHKALRLCHARTGLLGLGRYARLSFELEPPQGSGLKTLVFSASSTRELQQWLRPTRTEAPVRPAHCRRDDAQRRGPERNPPPPAPSPPSPSRCELEPV
mgnify:CR=1 FL=1